MVTSCLHPPTWYYLQMRMRMQPHRVVFQGQFRHVQNFLSPKHYLFCTFIHSLLCTTNARVYITLVAVCWFRLHFTSLPLHCMTYPTNQPAPTTSSHIHVHIFLPLTNFCVNPQSDHHNPTI